MKQVIDTIELLSSAHITGEAVAQVPVSYTHLTLPTKA